MVSQASKIKIEVDAQAAEILRRVGEEAQARGETLGAYLRRALPESKPLAESQPQQLAWHQFVEGMMAWTTAHLPSGYVADDSRETFYDDRN